jgi:hypothetical protein
MTSRQQKALAALIRAPTVEAAARASGIGYGTIRRWLREDVAFREAYKTALNEMIDDAAAQAKHCLALAFETLSEIMQNKGISPMARVSAARTALEYSLRLTEANDIIAQIREMERGYS